MSQENTQSKVILITGAGSGFGKALALQAAARGDTVVLLGRSIPKLEAVYDEIEAAGGPTPAIYPLDMGGATPLEFSDMVTRVTDALGRIDIVVQNAASLGALAPVELLEAELWQSVLSTDLFGPCLLSQAVIPSLRQQQGSLVYVLDDVRSAYFGGYGVAKAGLSALAQIVSAENDNINVLQFHPGVMRTALRSAAYPGEDPSQNPEPAIAATRLLTMI